MKRVFFIDYENVDTNGLNGISKLTCNDDVYIFYSESHSRMTFGLHRRICECKASFYYRKIETENKKDALDKELIKELREKAYKDSKAEYSIISNDKGYKKIICELIASNIKVGMFSVISDSNQQKKVELEKIIKKRLVNDSQYKLNDNEITQLANMFLVSESKNELNQNLQKMFYNEDVKYIFTRIKDITWNL